MATKSFPAKTPEFRVSFPNVFEARLNELNGKEEFSIMALFPKGADMSALKAAAKAAIEAKFGTDPKKYPKNLRTPFRAQDEKFKTDEDTGKEIIPPGMEKGGIFMTLRSQQAPAVVDQQKSLITDSTRFYPGCYAHATVRAYAYDVKGNKGVAFGLGNIQKTRDGESLGGRTSPEEDFEVIASNDNESGEAAQDAGSLF